MSVVPPFAPAIRPPPARRGFTLIELLVSFTLLGLFAVLLSSGLDLALSVFRRGPAEAERQLAVEAAEMFLRGRLEAIHPAWRADGDRGRIEFRGWPDSIVFLAPPAELASPATNRRWTLELEAEGTLVLTSRPDTDRALASEPDRTVLLDRVRGLRIGYRGPAVPSPALPGPGSPSSADPRSGAISQAPPETMAWTTEWLGRASLPGLIRIDLDPLPGERRPIPPLLIAPRFDTDAGCSLDPILGTCRGR